MISRIRNHFVNKAQQKKELAEAKQEKIEKQSKQLQFIGWLIKNNNVPLEIRQTANHIFEVFRIYYVEAILSDGFTLGIDLLLNNWHIKYPQFIPWLEQFEQDKLAGINYE